MRKLLEKVILGSGVLFSTENKNISISSTDFITDNSNSSLAFSVRITFGSAGGVHGDFSSLAANVKKAVSLRLKRVDVIGGYALNMEIALEKEGKERLGKPHFAAIEP